MLAQRSKFPARRPRDVQRASAALSASDRASASQPAYVDEDAGVLAFISTESFPDVCPSLPFQSRGSFALLGGMPPKKRDVAEFGFPEKYGKDD